MSTTHAAIPRTSEKAALWYRVLLYITQCIMLVMSFRPTPFAPRPGEKNESLYVVHKMMLKLRSQACAWCPTLQALMQTHKPRKPGSSV